MSHTQRDTYRDPAERPFPYVPNAVPVAVQPEQFERNHWAIHQAAPGTCRPCDKVAAWNAVTD